MHNVWLDDDDDDDDDDDENDADDEQHEKFKILKTDLFKKKASSSKKKKKSATNTDSYHTTAQSSGKMNVHEQTLSSPASASNKRKNSRRSFNFISGLAGNSETDSVLDKIKHSFSNKQESSSRLETIPAGGTSTSSSFIGRRTSLMNLRSKTSLSTFMTDDTASIMTSSTSATNKRSSMMFAHSIAPTMSSISSHSSSNPSKRSGSSAFYKPHNSSAKSKLFGLLKGGNRSSHSGSGMGVNHVYGSPYLGESAGHSNESSFSHSSKAAAPAKSKISSPLNFTHTAHIGASLFSSEVEPVTTTATTGTTTSTSTAMSSFHMPAPHRHERVTMENETRRISTPPPTALASTSAAAFVPATTAALSSTSSSFVGSPNMGATSIYDMGSISTTSVDEYSPISGSTKYHRAFFTQLNGVAAGSRLSFQGTESATMLDDSASNGLTPSAAGVIPLPHRSLFKRQSVDSLASLERHIGPGNGNPNRYSLPPGMLLSSASLRARSRLSINSTLSVDSVMSSIDRMSTPPPPMPLVQPQVLPDGMALERVHEEGWF